MQRQINFTPKDKIAVLMGGNSSERSISLESGRCVHAALLENNFNAVVIDARENLLETLVKLKPDCVFIALHGKGGEDGCVQGLLEYLGYPFTGSGVLGSALASHKLMTKNYWRAASIPTPAYREVCSKSDWSKVLEELGGKVIIKPANQGSSIGISLANSEVELKEAWAYANEYDSVVFAEEWIEGKEFSVAILGEQLLPPICIETAEQFYDYHAKYEANTTRYICPTDLSEDAIKELQQHAAKAFKALSCHGWGRVDFMQDSKQQFYALEVNTIPGMSNRSLFPIAAKNEAIDYATLVECILNSGDACPVGDFNTTMAIESRL